MEKYKQVRESLLDMLEGLDSSLGEIIEEPAHAEKTVSNQSIAIDTDTTTESNTTHDEIKKIKQAISRIDSGTFGICLICGQTIKKEQLNHTPFSSQCSHCSEKKDV